ncbi:hypothetical protein AB0I23_40765 [Streptomyces atratus]
MRVRATVLIEARLPEIDLRRTADPLIRQLLRTGHCRPYRIPRPAGGPGNGGAGDADYETGGLAVSERPYHLIDAHGVRGTTWSACSARRASTCRGFGAVEAMDAPFSLTSHMPSTSIRTPFPLGEGAISCHRTSTKEAGRFVNGGQFVQF